MKITKKRAIKLHRELWSWLSEHPKAEKSEWPGWKKNGGTELEIEHYCFCCEYVKQFVNYYEEDLNCKLCPVKWPDESCQAPFISKKMYLFDKWHYAYMDEKIEFAKQISKLPERRKRK